MEAPTPTSAYLHSATMVKAGVYLLARLSPVLGGTEVWTLAVGGVGAVTMLLAAYQALGQTDLKRLLAYSTVSALGTLVLLLGVGTPLAVQGALVFLLAHALYKGALFLVAGALDHETGTRDVERLRGLRRLMPITAAAGGLAALSMAGLPPLFGFIGKELFYAATLEAPRAGAWLAAAAVLSSMALVAAAVLVGVQPFFGPKLPTPEQPHEAPLSLWLGPVVLAGLGAALGLWPQAAAAVVEPATAGVLGQPATVNLALWHGWSPALALSAVTLVGGLALYAGVGRLRRTAAGAARALGGGLPNWYDAALAGLNALAVAQTRILQNGYLRYYLLTSILATVGVVGYALVRGGVGPGPARGPELRFYDVAVAALILLAALAAVRATSRLAAVAALGVVGYGVALVYVLYGAPDLAMTQVLIETLTVVLFVLVLYHLPQFTILTSGASRVRDALVALTAGGLMTMLVLVATRTPTEPRASAYYAAHAVTEAHGRNVVNTILVDFRALDTLGEITVLSLAAVGVYALLKLRAGGERS
jgi:multicomponent Na+:H+ antiporter subunit A